MPNTAIKVSHLTKVYKLYDKPIDRLKESLHPLKKKYHKDFYALNDVSFEIKKGETVGIIGKNGAGKSTLLKIITGVLTPSSGHVHVNGRIASLLELGAGFNPEYTGVENIYLQGTLMGYSHSEMEAKVDEILTFADIGDFVYQPVKMYSSGMFARLAFAVAINVDPDILIVDEALSVGDAAFQLKCFAKMQKLRNNGTTILFVSHDTYSVRTLCTNALWINKGCLVDAGNPVEVINNFLYDLNGIDTSEGEKTIKPVQVENITHKDIKLHFSSLQQITLQTEEKLRVEFSVENTGLIDYELVYVFNIYRQTDNLYICGSTTLIDTKKTDILLSGETKHIILDFDYIPLLVGTYRLRLAVNDLLGMGILCDIKEAIILNIKDNHQAEGLMHLHRHWSTKENI